MTKLQDHVLKRINPTKTQLNLHDLNKQMRIDIISVVSKYFPEDLGGIVLETLIDDQLDKIWRTWLNFAVNGEDLNE